MIDHIGLRTAQFDVMTAFYEQALAPLGIKKLTAYDGGAGFGRDEPVLWIGTLERASLKHPSGAVELGQVRRPGVSRRGPQGRREGQRRSRPARLRRRTITPPSSSTLTATTSRPSATAPEAEVAEGRNPRLLQR